MMYVLNYQQEERTAAMAMKNVQRVADTFLAFPPLVHELVRKDSEDYGNERFSRRDPLFPSDTPFLRCDRLRRSRTGHRCAHKTRSAGMFFFPFTRSGRALNVGESARPDCPLSGSHDVINSVCGIFTVQTRLLPNNGGKVIETMRRNSFCHIVSAPILRFPSFPHDFVVGTAESGGLQSVGPHLYRNHLSPLRQTWDAAVRSWPPSRWAVHAERRHRVRTG
jgi:hypothetical protein